MLSSLYAYRYLWLVLLLLVAVLLGPGLQRALQVDNSLQAWFLEDDPALQAYQDFKTHFGNDEVVILLIKDEKGVLCPAYFTAFRALSKALEALPDVAQVLGPGNAQLPTKGPMGMAPGPLLTAESQPADVKKQLEANPLFREQLFTPEYTAARFLVVLKEAPDFDERRGAILEQLQATVAQYLPEQVTHYGGIGILFTGLNALSQQDFGLFLALGYGAMFLLLLWIYRSGWVLLYALATVGLASWLTLGLYGALGYRLNLMTTLIPTILVLLGMLDVVHVVHERKLLAAEGGSPRELALAALQTVWKPCLFTTLTTMAGFLALLISPMAILKGFGVFAALGILLCLLCTYVLGLVLLPLVRPAGRLSNLSGQALGRFHQGVLGHKRFWTAVSGGAGLLCLLGMGLLRADTFTLGYFPPDHRVVQDHVAIESSWGSYLPLELLVLPREGLELHAPEVVQAALAFGDSAQTLPGLGRVFGFATLYQAGIESQYGNKSRQLLGYKSGLLQADRQLRLHYPALLRQYRHDASGMGRITVSGRMLTATALTAKMDSLLAIAEATLGPVASVKAAGYQPMYAGIVRYVTFSQVYSLALALLLVFVLVWIFIGSLRLALLSVVPTLFPIALMLGVMGWLGIRLDVATASIAAIVLSFCIDDTLHFLHRYRALRQQGLSPLGAQQETLRRVGTALLLTSFILLVGYSLMIFASLKTVQLFGALTALAIAGSVYSQLVALPLLLDRFDGPMGPPALANQRAMSPQAED